MERRWFSGDVPRNVPPGGPRERPPGSDPELVAGVGARQLGDGATFDHWEHGKMVIFQMGKC